MYNNKMKIENKVGKQIIGNLQIRTINVSSLICERPP